jgi:DNA-binding GntR family transcriptional regulator
MTRNAQHFSVEALQFPLLRCMARGLSLVLLLSHALKLSHKEHPAIYTAIKRGDAEGARKAMQAHLGAALKRYDSAMEKQVLVHDKPAKAAKFTSVKV